MSSTNRSSARNTHISDYYVTPISCIQDFLQQFTKDVQLPESLLILDPCAGGDEHNPMSYPVAINRINQWFRVDTIDIRNTSLADEKSDYLLKTIQPEKYDIIITNPPFNLAQEIITKALYDVRSGGYVIMLLRLNFFGSKARFPFWENQLPTHAYVHHRRMSFTDDGKTDSIEYMHCVWQKDIYPESTKLKII